MNMFNKGELMEIENSLLLEISQMERDLRDDIKSGRCELDDYGIELVKGLIVEKRRFALKVRGYIVSLDNIKSIEELMSK